MQFTDNTNGVLPILKIYLYRQNAYKQEQITGIEVLSDEILFSTINIDTHETKVRNLFDMLRDGMYIGNYNS